MLKSASLGDEKDVQRQNSLSQILHQNVNMNGSKISNNNAKIQSHSRVGSRNLLLDNDSSKDTLHLQPISLIPTASQSQYISLKHFDAEENLQSNLKNNIGAREGAEARSRLFLENKDIFLPKNDFSQDDIPAINDVIQGESLTEIYEDKQANKQTNKQSKCRQTREYFGDNSLRQKLTPMRDSLLDGSSPLRLNNKEFQNEVKNRPQHINSQSATKAGSAIANTIVSKQHRDVSTNNLVPSVNQFSNTHNIFSNNSHTSNLINNIVSSGLGVPISARKNQSQVPSSQKIPAPSQTYFPYTGDGLKVFMFINHFACAMKKILVFLRPKSLNKLQMDCINDKGASDYNDLSSNDKQNNQDLKHATRLWITKRTMCYHFIRDLKKKFKFLYIAYYQMTLRIQRYQIMIEKKLPYINPISFGWRLWDFFILLVTLLNFVYIPLDYSFGIGSDLPIKTISAFIFFFDIFRLFSTAFFDCGRLVTNRHKIFFNYLKSNFIFDIVTALSLIIEPFDYTSLLFFIRFLYISSLTERVKEILTNYKRIKGFANLGLIFLNVIYHCHLISCLWFYIGNDQQSNGDFGWLKRFDLVGKSKEIQYLNSYYFSVITLTNAKGDILPQSDKEKIFFIFCSFYACGILAYILYSASATFSQINKKNVKLLNQLSSLNKYLDQHDVSPSLRIQAQKYVEYINNEGMQEKQDSISSLNHLSKYLKEEIVKDVFIKQFKRIQVLNQHFSNSNLLEKLSTKVKEQVFGPGEVILRSNKPEIPCLYFIIQGEVEIYVDIGSQTTNKSRVNTFKVLKKNDYFGQVEFFSQNYTTSLSVKARGFTQIQYISLFDFLESIQSFPDEKEAFCYLKDQVTLNNSFDKIGISCFSCKSSNHVVMKCPYLFYHQSKDRIIRQLEQTVQQQINAFKRSTKRKKFETLCFNKHVLDRLQSFSQNYEDLINTSVYEEYQDEMDSEQRSFFKQQTCPQFEERSTYTRKTSKKQSLKQTSTVEELPNFHRKNSQKKQSLKMLNPNSLEEIHEKSQISRISQFSNRQQNVRGESITSEEKKFIQAQQGSSTNDPDQSAIQNRKRTHSNLSQILGSRKSPFPSEREWNRSYSGSLISSLKLSEADKKIILIEERNGMDGTKIQQIPGAPNLFVIKVNEGDEFSLINHRGYSNMNNGQASANTFDPSDYQNRRHNSNFSLMSRGIVQSSQLTSMNQPIDEFSELRLDQTNRIRENSFIPNHILEADPLQGFYLNNDDNVMFEEQQNFKLYFAHNNLQNIINKPKKPSQAPSKNNLNAQPNRKQPKKSSYLRVVSVNNKASNKVLGNQLEVNPALLPYNINAEVIN